jgi:hypothetical protein
MDAPDIIYVCRPGESNPALRFSLRSLANVPHNRVFISGYCPSWVRNVTAISVRKLPSKLNAIENNLRHALKHSELGDWCNYFNDDFFVLEPVSEVPITHGGPVEEFALRQEFRWRMDRTVKALADRGIEQEMLTYDGVHMPLPLVTERAREILREIPSGVLWRTWYGNVAAIGGVRVPNTKSRNGEIVEGAMFLSTSNMTLRALREYLEDALPKGGPYV